MLFSNYMLCKRMLCDEDVFNVLKNEAILLFEENFSEFDVVDYNFSNSEEDYYYSTEIKNLTIYNEKVEFKFRYSFEDKKGSFLFLFKIESSQYRFEPTREHKELNSYRIYFRSSIKNFVRAAKIRIKIGNFANTLLKKGIRNVFEFSKYKFIGEMYKEKFVIYIANEKFTFTSHQDKSINELIKFAEERNIDYSTLLE